MVVIFTPHLMLGLAMLLVWAVITRVAHVLVSIWFGGPTDIPKGSTIKTLVVLGSGGHTGEMLKLIRGLDASRYRPLVYVVAKTDLLSRDRLKELQKKKWDEKNPHREKNIVDNTTTEEGCHKLGGSCVQKSLTSDLEDSSLIPNNKPLPLDSVVEVIPRSREVGQSYFTSIFTTLIAIVGALKVVIKHRPDLILVNGPGSCIPICICGLFLRMLALCRGRITFVESLCRVRSVSLTGKILYWFSDDFIVQWPELKEKYPRSKYLGRLV